MDARIITLVLIIACVPVYNGFRVPPPMGIGSASESSWGPSESVEPANSPGLLLLHGPVGPSSDAEQVESESSEAAELESESDNGNEAAAGGAAGELGGAGLAQARPDAGAGAAGAAGAGNATAAAPGQALPGGPQQISSSHAGAAVGVGVAVGACFLAILAVGATVYAIRRRRQVQNNPERLQ